MDGKHILQLFVPLPPVNSCKLRTGKVTTALVYFGAFAIDPKFAVASDRQRAILPVNNISKERGHQFVGKRYTPWPQ